MYAYWYGHCVNQVLYLYNRIPCSSLGLWRDILVGGYGDGQLRLYCAKTAKLSATVNAHARWVNAIDIAPETGRVLSVSEDTFAKVWQLKEGNLPEVCKYMFIFNFKYLNWDMILMMFGMKLSGLISLKKKVWKDLQGGFAYKLCCVYHYF